MAMNDLVSLSAVEMRSLIAKKDVSPVDLVEACIARIERINPAVNAIAATCYDRARDEAKHAEQALVRGDGLGLLHGLPIGIKDIEDTAGLLSTYGSPLYRNHVPNKDAAIVARLRAAGAIIVGKTNIPEMGAGANTRNPVWGATGNPFSPLLTAGGSSGGSAAALATDMLPLCTGSDTGGSLRIPAAYCGVVGLRPSVGLVPNQRKPLGWSPISVVGPMARSVADLRLQLAAMVGLHESDPLSYAETPERYLERAPVDLSALRVAWTEDFGVCAVDPAIRSAFREKIASIEHWFAKCEPLAIDLGEAHRTFDVIRAEAFVAGFQDVYERSRDALASTVRSNYEMGAALSLNEVARAQAAQTKIFHAFQEAFGQYDILLSPVAPVSPFPWARAYVDRIGDVALENYYRWIALTYVVTLATNPALSLPCGTDHLGMPFGLQIVGKFRGDRELLSIAAALESEFCARDDLRRSRPDIEGLPASVAELRSVVTAPSDRYVRGAIC